MNGPFAGYEVAAPLQRLRGTCAAQRSQSSYRVNAFSCRHLPCVRRPAPADSTMHLPQIHRCALGCRPLGIRTMYPFARLPLRAPRTDARERSGLMAVHSDEHERTLAFAEIALGQIKALQAARHPAQLRDLVHLRDRVQSLAQPDHQRDAGAQGHAVAKPISTRSTTPSCRRTASPTASIRSAPR